MSSSSGEGAGQPYFVSYAEMKKALRSDLKEDMRNNFLNNTRIRPTRKKLQKFMKKKDADKTIDLMRKKVRTKEHQRQRQNFDALKEVNRERLELRQELAGEESDDSSVAPKKSRVSRRSGRSSKSRKAGHASYRSKRSGRSSARSDATSANATVTIPSSEAIFGPYQYYQDKDAQAKARRLPRRLECPNLDKVCRELDEAEQEAQQLKEAAAKAASRQSAPEPKPDPCEPPTCEKVSLQDLQDMTDKITIMRVLVQRDEEKVKSEVERLEDELVQMQQHADELRLGRRRAERILTKNLEFDRSSDICGSIFLEDESLSEVDGEN